MSIPEACINAAKIGRFEFDDPEKRARRVILALAENMPPDAVEKALRRYYNIDDEDTLLVAFEGSQPRVEAETRLMRAAIAAFLKHVAGDQP